MNENLLLICVCAFLLNNKKNSFEKADYRIISFYEMNYSFSALFIFIS